ncbi:MAG: hypothetical protein Q8O22_05885 [Candidatus Omnitrophota bacterium]|nr:hypothetical protein [Candidatus Omnitrophota bacterium]
MLNYLSRKISGKVLFFLAIWIFSVAAQASAAGTEAGAVESQGIMMVMQGQVDEGLELMKRSLKMEPNNAARHMNYASMLMAKGKSFFDAGQPADGEKVLVEAQEHLFLAIKLFKNTPPDRLSKSQCYALLGDIYLYGYDQKEKALGYYRQALAEDPANAGVNEIVRELNG